MAARSKQEVTDVLDKANVDSRKMTSILKALGQERNLRACAWAFEWAREQEMLDVFHYSQYISILGRSRKVVEALEVFGEMQAAGVSANTITYNALISA